MCAWSAGVFTRTNGVFSGSSVWNSDKGAGVNIVTSRHDTHDQDLAAGINACLVKDGTNSPTANLPMGGYKHTGVANATARSEYASLGQVQDGAFTWLGTAGGTATALTASATPAITAYATGQKFRVVTSAASTGTTATAHTININGLGAKNIIVNSGAAVNPTAGSWISGAVLELVYDGTNFRLLNDAGGWQAHSISSIGGGTMSVTINTTHFANYKKVGNIVHLSLSLTVTTGGVATPYIDINLPVNAVNAGVFDIHPCIIGDTASTLSVCRFDTAGNVRVLKEPTGVSNWGLGGSRFLSLNIAYQSV